MLGYAWANPWSVASSAAPSAWDDSQPESRTVPVMADGSQPPPDAAGDCATAAGAINAVASDRVASETSERRMAIPPRIGRVRTRKVRRIRPRLASVSPGARDGAVPAGHGTGHPE